MSTKKFSVFAAVLLWGATHATAQAAPSISLTPEGQRNAIREFAGLYRQLPNDQRAFVLPLIAGAVNGQLPLRQNDYGLELRRLQALPNDTMAMRLRWLKAAETGPELSRQELGGNLEMLARAVGCKDESVRELIGAGIRIQLDIEDGAGVQLASAALDSASCKTPDDIESHLRALGVE
ncbi:hypothetical protein V3390_01430 [Luteimonas sp. FXH3W]|uniref:Uncharacterized protein n=1 Tax=Aquilutibacter rugosus TaxID=3115820 RepID=A0ABU7UXF1_9GAMM